MERHRERSRPDGNEVVFTLKEANADLPYLLDDYHLIIQPNGGKDKPDAGIGTGPYKVTVNEPGVRHGGEKFANYWQRQTAASPTRSRSSSSTTRRRASAALQGGQVHMINRVEPKIVDLIKRVPGVDDPATSPAAATTSSSCHCNTAPFDNNDLQAGAEAARIDREEMLQKILQRLRLDRQRLPDQQGLSAVHRRHRAARITIRTRPRSTTRSRAIAARSCCAPPTSRSPARSMPPQLYQQSAAKAGITIEVKREPGDGYWSEVWNKQPFSASYWGGRPTQDQMYSTAYLFEGRLERHALPAPGLRQDAVPGARRTRRRQAQGDLSRRWR